MPETWEELSKVFKLDRKDCSTGIKHISKFAPKKSPLRTTYITPIDLVDSIMDKFDATKEQKLEVINIYKQIENSSYKLNQSRPKSVACSLVYFWIKKTGKDMSIKDFTDNVQLSEITVDKLSKEIERVIEEKKNKLKRILQVATQKEIEIKNKNFVEKNHITPIEDIINFKDDESIDKLIDSHSNFKHNHIRKDITKQKNDKLKKIQTTKPRKHKN
jgi:transcription initiation factor TFIIIB Brf1 subunit/transcription initiation factor TFIIB